MVNFIKYFCGEIHFIIYKNIESTSLKKKLKEMEQTPSSHLSFDPKIKPKKGNFIQIHCITKLFSCCNQHIPFFLKQDIDY